MDDFLRFSKNLGFWVFLVHPTEVSVLLSASVERCFVSRMRDFFSSVLLPGYIPFAGPNPWPEPCHDLSEQTWNKAGQGKIFFVVVVNK